VVLLQYVYSQLHLRLNVAYCVLSTRIAWLGSVTKLSIFMVMRSPAGHVGIQHYLGCIMQEIQASRAHNNSRTMDNFQASVVCLTSLVKYAMKSSQI